MAEATNFKLKNDTLKVYSYDENIKEFFEQIIHDNKFTMYKIAKGILKSQADMDDAVGEAILKAFLNLGSLKDYNSIKVWTFRILINQCYDIIKKRQGEVLTDQIPVETSFCQANHESFELLEVINLLEENLRIVTILFYYGDMTIKDISVVLNLPEGTVKSRLARAKGKLKKMLKDRD